MSPSATWGPASTLLFPDSIFCETRRVRSATGCHAMLIIVPRSILANLCGRTKEENVHVRISVAVHRDDGFASSAQQFVDAQVFDMTSVSQEDVSWVSFPFASAFQFL